MSEIRKRHGEGDDKTPESAESDHVCEKNIFFKLSFECTWIYINQLIKLINL